MALMVILIVVAGAIGTFNKKFGSQFLLSDAARNEAADEAADARLLGRVAIRGYDGLVPLWQLA